METESLYTIIVHSENFAGILNQVAAVFTRLQVNIESLNVSASSLPNVHKFTICCRTTEKNIDKIIKQIVKKLDVISAACYTDSDIFSSEIAMYKISTHVFDGSDDLNVILRKYNTRVVEVTSDYIVVELAGSSDEITALRDKFQNLGCIRQFVRSGKIAVTASNIEKVSEWLDRREKVRTERSRIL